MLSFCFFSVAVDAATTNKTAAATHRIVIDLGQLTTRKENPPSSTDQTEEAHHPEDHSLSYPPPPPPPPPMSGATADLPAGFVPARKGSLDDLDLQPSSQAGSRGSPVTIGRASGVPPPPPKPGRLFSTGPTQPSGPPSGLPAGPPSAPLVKQEPGRPKLRSGM